MTSRFAGRRFSWLRLTVVLAVLAGIGWGTWTAVSVARDTATAAAEGDPWFAGYVDVTATPTYSFESATGDGTDHVVLSFIVAADSATCTPTWGTYYTLDQAASDLDLDRRIARLRAQERDVVVSFGGLSNAELGDACATSQELATAYGSVIDRYELSTIDLDLEGPALEDADAMQRRAEAVEQLQSSRPDDEPLAVWLTLPISPTGLTEAGTDTVTTFLDAGVDLAGVNAMTMDYGDAKDTADSMSTASIKALTALHSQLGILYDRAGTHLGSASLWRKIGATPMIGQNDVRDEVFGIDDATELHTFAVQQGLARMSMWSLNRDRTCSANYPDTSVVSTSCSGIDQDDASFAAILSTDFPGHPDDSAGEVTAAEAETAPAEDDPATSPYPIWNTDSSYLAGSKIVWHGNVYEAKWWTQGDTPDDPVLQSYETPWTLIGPVLPGEKPVPAPTLPADFYPDWDPDATYEAGDRVLWEGVAFQARWWNQGDSPEAGQANPGDSPWLALDEATIRELLDDGQQ